MNFSNILDETPNFENTYQQDITNPVDMLNNEKINICKTCNVEMNIFENDGISRYICDNCGNESELLQTSKVGKNEVTSYFGKSKYFGNPKYVRRMQVLDEFKRICIDNNKTGIHIPLTIIEDSVELYSKIQDNYILRSSIKSGTMAYCVYINCVANKIGRTLTDIQSIFDVLPKKVSKGANIYLELVSQRIIENVRDKESTAHAHILYYFEVFEIDKIYIKLAEKLFTFSDDYRIQTNVKLSSKIAGIIYAIMEFINMEIDHDYLHKTFTYTKGTYSKFYLELKKIIKYKKDNSKILEIKSKLIGLLTQFEISC